MYLLGLSGGSVVKNPPANAGDVGPILGLGRSSGEGWQPTLVFLPGKFHRQRSLAGYIPGACKELATAEHTKKH